MRAGFLQHVFGRGAAQAAGGAEVDVERLFRLRLLAREGRRARPGEVGRSGGAASRRRGAGLDFHDVRPYVEGDDTRRIDAMATARTGFAHVRSFDEETELIAFLVADFRRPMLWGTRKRLLSVAAAEALALAGWSWVDRVGGLVGVMTIADAGDSVMRPKRGEAGMAEAIGLLASAHRRALAEPERQAVAALDRKLIRLAQVAPRGATVYLASSFDAPGPDCRAAIDRLARRLHLDVLLPRDAFERQPPRGVYPFFTEERQGVATVAGAADEDSARAGLLKRAGVSLKILDADASDRQLAAALRKEAR